MSQIRDLPLGEIVADHDGMPRAGLDQAHIADLVEALEGGAALPPLVIFFDGERYFLSSGFHRHAAYGSIGRRTVTCDVREGTVDDARLFAAGENKEHLGLKRSHSDKRRAVLLAVASAPQWSRAQVARHCGVTPTLVTLVLATLEEVREAERAAEVAEQLQAEEEARQEQRQSSVAIEDDTDLDDEEEEDGDLDQWADDDADDDAVHTDSRAGPVPPFDPQASTLTVPLVYTGSLLTQAIQCLNSLDRIAREYGATSEILLRHWRNGTLQTLLPKKGRI